MPYARNGDVRIHYEVVGAGSPLVLQHGSFGSGEDWRDFGYTDVLKQDRLLILIDARGHGRSDKPHEPAAYDLASRVGDVTAVLDDLRIGQADYLGYSMGGWIGFGLAKYAAERVRALAIGGAHPYQEDMAARRRLLPQEPAAFLALVEQLVGSYMTPAMRSRLLANDLRALSALTSDRAAVADVLPSMDMPCLLFVGEADPRLQQVQVCREHLPHARFVSLPDCDHVAAIARSDLVLPHLRDFLAAIV